MSTGSTTGTDGSMLSNAWSERIAQTMRHSLSIKLVLLGIAFIIGGYVRQTGSFAAMLAVWGGALVLVGSVSYITVWYTRR